MRYLRFCLILVTFSMAFLTACNTEEEKVKDSVQDEKMLKPNELSNAFLNGDYEKVYRQTSKAFQDAVTLKQFQELGEEFNKDVTIYILQSEIPYGNGAKKYIWTDDSGSKGMVAIFDEDDIIQGLQVMPLSMYPETDNIYTETVFDFPFQDKWFVFWGGTNSLVNYHYAYENQRYAYDFVVMNEKSTYEGDPTLNESYYAFGKEYLAPADGMVVKVENSVKDNKPVGRMNKKQPLGNYVILDHGNKEFSYLVHFKYQSIVVKEGDKVKKGDLLGLVGNSGNSSEPHIHFHVADSSDPLTSKSINITFDRENKFIHGDFVE
ncbi:M23 family metallopeptidase [Sporosarcina sp. Marseille-Q4943]|uniref:M23 family metallopeptidase n=1 Tax=Sporosarcina sp. Marseille-Q4943 TaxID=2942204 RepID=UPI00208DA536|nr:M23 family metallopeptidase [Sporosarcina sp. Marseille-Q4943]